jgi:hypothetical protein
MFGAIFGFIGAILDLVFWITVLAFVAGGAYYVLKSGPAGYKSKKRVSRGYKHFGAAALLLVLSVFFPVWAIALVGLGGGYVALNRDRKVRHALPGTPNYQRYLH